MKKVYNLGARINPCPVEEINMAHSFLCSSQISCVILNNTAQSLYNTYCYIMDLNIAWSCCDSYFLTMKFYNGII